MSFDQRLKEPFYQTITIQMNPFGRGRFRQARHGHDFSADGHNEAGSGGKTNFPYVHDMVYRRPPQMRVRRE